MLTDFQKTWAEKNKKETSSNLSLWLLFTVFVWSAVVLTFLPNFDPELLPAWAVSLGVGLRWTYVIMVLGVGLLFTVLAPFSLLSLYSFGDKIQKREDLADAKNIYDSNKGEIASRLAYKWTVLQTLRLAVTFLQAGLFFAGGAYFAGIVTIGFVVWFNLVMVFLRGFTEEMAKDTITPENVQWVEGVIPLVATDNTPPGRVPQVNAD